MPVDTTMTISPEVVRAEVARFWTAFVAKSPDLVEEFYAPQSSVFATTGSRSEPGRLAAKRREREYFSRDTALRYQLGYIDVVLLSDTTAIASYTFQFHATKMGIGSRSEEHVTNGRATQVLGVDTDGKVRIFHEHFSTPTT